MYKDLNQEYKERINALLLEAYDNITDQDIIKRLKLYPESQRYTELHSTIGTEVAHISPELEEHYAQYFKDRKLILAFTKESKHEMRSRSSIISLLDKKLRWLKNQINDLTKLHLARQKHISDLKNFIEEENNNYTRSQLIENHDDEVVTYNSELVTYNNLVSEYKNILNKLLKSNSDKQKLEREAFVPIELTEQARYN
jgi:predicted O-linked N-acetylglucosamine transferase (SPINDLY family)